MTTVIAYELNKIQARNNQKAIESTYAPQIVIQQDTFYIYSIKQDEKISPIEFSYEYKDVNYLSDNTKPWQPFGLHLYNIGMGSTKKITVTFEFDVNAAIELINNMNSQINNLGTKIIYKKGKNGASLETDDLLGISFQFFNLDEKVEISHLLSVNIVDKPYVLLLPFYLQALYRGYYYNWFKVLTEKKSQPSEFPSVYINMKFSDIGNNVFNKRFKIDFTFGGGSLQTSTHYIKVEEILLL